MIKYTSGNYDFMYKTCLIPDKRNLHIKIKKKNKIKKQNKRRLENETIIA